MSNDILGLAGATLRGTDTNSLLRIYDSLRVVSSTSPSELERARADKVLARIAAELQKRRVPL